MASKDLEDSLAKEECTVNRITAMACHSLLTINIPLLQQ
jgi:hypothetical protein